MPVISIIIPVYNGGKYIQRCLNSIVSQDFSDYELLIIDDGSTDSSGEICNYYASKYDNVEVVHIPNGGVSHARNIGILKAEGKYVIFVDADDELLPNALKIVAETIAEEKEPDFLIFDNCVKIDDIIIYPHSKVSHNERYDSSHLLDGYWQARIGTSFPAPWGKAYKNDIIRAYNILFDENLNRNEDEVFNCCFLSKVDNLVLRENIIYVYYNTQQSAVSKFYGFEIEYMIKTVANANREMMLKVSCDNEEKARSHYNLIIAQLINLHINSLYSNKIRNRRKWLEYIINIGRRLLQDDVLYNSLMQVGHFRAKVIAIFYKHTSILHLLQVIMQLRYDLLHNFK